MSFGEHLDELRRRLILAIAAPLPLAVIFFTFAEPIRTWMCLPLVRALQSNRLPVQLQTLNPVETVLLDMKLGIVLSLVVSAPWILWQIWAFVAPGLHRHERRFVQFLLPASGALTALGVALLFYLVLPLMLTMLVSFGVGSSTSDLPQPIAERPVAPTSPAPPEGPPVDPPVGPPSPPAASPEGTPATPHLPQLPQLPANIPVLAEHPTTLRAGDLWIKTPENLLCVAIASDGKIEILVTSLGRNTLVVQQYRLSEYIDFVLMMTASIALAFQMPLVILLLGWLGIVELKTLRSHRKHALFACAILAAVLTPSADFISMMLALVPLYLLYELGLILLHVLPASRIAGEDVRRSAPPQPVAATGNVARRSEQGEE